jgi:hypothetical protein
VTDYDGTGGYFKGVEGKTKKISTNARVNSPNFFCLRAPYFYLECWVVRDSLPPRQTTFPLEPNMSFEGEFYEIVHSWPYGKRTLSFSVSELWALVNNPYSGDSPGTLNGIKYEGIEESHDGGVQSCFGWIWGSATELGRDLKSGLRGNDLISGLLRDFKVWQTSPTDR